MPDLSLPLAVPSHANEPMFGGEEGRSYDGGREVFIAKTLATPFVGDDSLSDFSGDTGSVSIGNDGLSADGLATITTSEPGPEPGEQFCATVSASSLNDAWLLYFGTVDSSNTYFARVDFGAGTLELGALESGSTTTYDTAIVSVASSTDYTLKVAWHTDDKLSAELLDPDDASLGSVAADASAGYSAGGYGHEFTGAGVFTNALRECGTVADYGVILRHTESWEVEAPDLPQQHTESWEVEAPDLPQQHIESWEP